MLYAVVPTVAFLVALIVAVYLYANKEFQKSLKTALLTSTGIRLSWKPDATVSNAVGRPIIVLFLEESSSYAPAVSRKTVRTGQSTTFSVDGQKGYLSVFMPRTDGGYWVLMKDRTIPANTTVVITREYWETASLDNDWVKNLPHAHAWPTSGQRTPLVPARRPLPPKRLPAGGATPVTSLFQETPGPGWAPHPHTPGPMKGKNQTNQTNPGRLTGDSGWDKHTPVSSVIATIYSGSSYDALFREVAQKPPEEGLAVSLFQFPYRCLETIHKCLTGKDISREPDADVIREFCADVGRAEPHSVVLNFECCSHASSSGFSQAYGPTVMKLTRLFLDRQHMVVFADFSVKALITDWDTVLLGPNPFIAIGELSSSFDLQFDPDTLRRSPSSQLATAASLCDQGHATVRALDGTIMFTVDPLVTDTNRYHLEVLTVAVKVDNMDPPQGSHTLCSLPTDHSVKGAAGHVLLHYPSPRAEGQEGLLLVSMGHWIELAHLDVKLEGIVQHAKKVYGADYARSLSQQILSSPASTHKAQLQFYARTAVTQASPASYGFRSVRPSEE